MRLCYDLACTVAVPLPLMCSHRNSACSVAGITSDANVLTTYLRQVAQRYNIYTTILASSSYVPSFSMFTLLLYRYSLCYQESIPCEQLVMRLCDLKQAYTQFGGMRGLGGGGVWFYSCSLQRQASVWSVSAVHGLGPTLWLPAVPERPQWQLRRLEGYVHREQPPGKQGDNLTHQPIKHPLPLLISRQPSRC